MVNKGKSEMLILYDGYCNLCNASVRFIYKRDPNAIFRFSSLQSDYSKSVLQKTSISPDKQDSIVLFKGEEYFVESTAVLMIARNLSGIWPIFYVLIILPRPFRDYLYRLLAKSRYKLFGKKDHCEIPDKHIAKRFIK